MYNTLVSEEARCEVSSLIREQSQGLIVSLFLPPAPVTRKFSNELKELITFAF
jgi:hypothetical protein